MLTLALYMLLAQEPTSPVEFGSREIAKVAGERAEDVRLTVRPDGRKESYAITSSGGKVTIVGSDANGAMYGAFEFAERIRNEGDAAWSTQAKSEPYLADRGLNLFLTLPWDYAKNDTDYEVAALTDPQRWWFANEDYWTTLLDLMASSRLNWLDIHGAWDVSVTNAPNLYAYFVTSPTFPLVGVPQEVKEKNLARLNWVIEQAHRRGIRVSLMAYEANLRIPQNPSPPYDPSEANIYTYTREVVEQMVRRAPGLDAIGFRIGESGRGESFFTCYHEAVEASGRDIPLVTRSWITRRQRVLPLARASKDFTVEIKYNGEQWGAPYMVAGGRVANWYSYSFEDYLSDAGAPETNAMNWPGNPAEGGGTWPSNPYKIVWQVRANGTHRIFPFYNPDWVRRTIQQMKIGTASGYTIEGEDAYYPKRPDYYLADPNDRPSDWIHQRDEMYWTTWGRLGYDPNVPDEVFDRQAVRMLGAGTEELVSAWKEASLVIPLAFMGYSLGPDHRNHAPELEWGGDTYSYIYGQGFDTHSILPVAEEFAYRTVGGKDGRYSLYDYRQALGQFTFSPGDLSPFTESASAKVRGIANTVFSMAYLANYYRTRLSSAHEQARNQWSLGSAAYDEHDKFPGAVTAMGRLADDPYYRPFTERLRMRTNTFKWADELTKVRAEASRLSELPAPPTEVRFWAANMNGPTRGDLTWAVDGTDVVVRLECEGADSAFLLVKPLPSSTFFHKAPMAKVGDHFEARIRREREGHAVAAEAFRGEDGARFPNMQNKCPYLVVPAQSGPTPPFYSSEEAMTYLDPKSLDPQKHGVMLVAPRAYATFRRFDRATKRKLLDPVYRGMTLLVLQQDYMSGRYPLDFLPAPLKVENNPEPGVFDPAGALGLSRIESPDIMWQRFAPSEGWEILGNGAVAHMLYGQGHIWLVQGRFMQKMVEKPVARALNSLLSLNGTDKPCVLVDPGTEDAFYSTSLYPDFMNAIGVPFLTLGEVVGAEQGATATEPIPGPVWDDDVLAGRGSQIANTFLREQVMSWSKRTPPTSVADFEKERQRRKAELMRSLALDPMPERSPLNARTTGIVKGDGYTIEKVVFESRPKFYVTAHVYKATGVPPIKMPVVVNVNGHWAHKKDEDRIQLRCAFQALHGYLAVAIDSPGTSFEGDSLIERRAEGPHNDWSLVLGGTNATGYYVWDTVRALDYLATRPDTDMGHVGLTGASGGGLATLYAFAADDRFAAAVPVVYMSSMELAPDNGCLCNHVPGTCQIGDRSDVIGIQAPKPVYIMGAENDAEFPPGAMRLTAEKMKREWGLFGRQSDVLVQIFPGPHDYNQAMREASIGFFDRHLRGIGDGSPVPQPSLRAFDPEDRNLLVLDPPIAGERTLRQLSEENLYTSPPSVPGSKVIELNGGLPEPTPLNYRENGTGARRTVTFDAEPGLTTPGILVVSPGGTTEIIVDDRGKSVTAGRPVAIGPGPRLFLDVLGTGELASFEMRYPVYLGRSPAFIAGWQIVRAAEAMKRYSREIKIVANGPFSTMAAMYAALIEPELTVEASGCVREWGDLVKPGIPVAAIQPRAHLMGTLDSLRGQVAHGTWSFEGSGSQ